MHSGIVAALHAAGTPVPRRLSTSSGNLTHASCLHLQIGQLEGCSDIPDSAVTFHAGSKASVVPPHTPGDDMPTPLTVGPGVITSEYATTQ